MLEWVAWTLVVSGLVVVGSLYVLRVEAGHYVGCANELIGKRPQAGTDALAWFQLARPTLESAGVVGLRYRGNWFGGAIEGDWGLRRGERRSRPLAAGDMSLTVELWLKPVRGERRMLRDGVLSVFDLLLQQSMLGKAEAVAVALAQQAELSLYLQHDVKNLTQWVLLVTDQFESADDDSLPRIARHLREHAGIARRKAEHLADLLGRTQHPDPAPVELDLFSEARVYAGFHGILLKTPAGNLRIKLVRSVIERVLDAVFSSLADPKATDIEVELQVDNGDNEHRLRILSNRPPRLPTARLFEPLLDETSGPGGLGLYQARLAAQSIGGELKAVREPRGIAYSLTLPAL